MKHPPQQHRIRAVDRPGAVGHALLQRRRLHRDVLGKEARERHIDYIYFNPVKHGHVIRVADWPHSSFHRFVKAGLLPTDWGG